jgi:hypothetical protein
VNVRECCQGSELELYNSVLGCECTSYGYINFGGEMAACKTKNWMEGDQIWMELWEAAAEYGE